MRKRTPWILGTLAVWSAIWWFLGFLGNLQTAQGIFENRGQVLEVVGLILTSQWLPLGLFLLGVGALVWIQWLAPRRRKDEREIVIQDLPCLSNDFFGREKELKKIADSLKPNVRPWGALIDGPAGMGKTALAIRAAELAALTRTGRFKRIIFFSAKKEGFTAAGKMRLSFVVSGYLNMLNELARELGQKILTETSETDRPRELQRALQNQSVLLIFDDLESLAEDDRNKLFEFLINLPTRGINGCKAIVTSRPLNDPRGGSEVRLEPNQDFALEFVNFLSKKGGPMSQTTKDERRELCESTNGVPLLILWVAGLLTLRKCKKIAEALLLLRNAPKDNDPLEFIFGHLVDAITGNEIKVLAALSYFTTPINVQFIAELSQLGTEEVQAALGNLIVCPLVRSDGKDTQFGLIPLVADFLRRKCPDVVGKVGQRLIDSAYTIVKGGGEKVVAFGVLENQWSAIAAALPLILTGTNERLQATCDALMTFLSTSGRWDERISLASQAEKAAIASEDFFNAGWRAFQAGHSYSARGDAQNVLSCADRAEEHWEVGQASSRERGLAKYLRGIGQVISKDYSGAIATFGEAIDFFRSLPGYSLDLVKVTNALANAERLSGDPDTAERHCHEALRISSLIGFQEGIANSTSNLAAVALYRESWRGAEALARDGLTLAENLIVSEKVGHRRLIAANCTWLARALLEQNRREYDEEAERLIHRAGESFNSLRSPDLNGAQETLAQCEALLRQRRTLRES